MRCYTRPHLLSLIQGADSSGAQPTGPRRGGVRSHLAPTPSPLPALSDADSFRRMFDRWVLDRIGLHSCRARPGGNVTVVVAGELTSQQVIKYEDGATGMLKTDCLGQRHFFSWDSIHCFDPLCENVTIGKDVRLWLVKEYHAMKDELENWWEAQENSQAALKIQADLLRSFLALHRRTKHNDAAMVTSWQILKKPFVVFNTALGRLYRATNPTSPGSPSFQELGPALVRSLLNEKVQFCDLVEMAWMFQGLEILWNPITKPLAFGYDVKIVRIIPSHVDPTDLDLERKRVVIPRWKTETIGVPFDCDWKRLNKHLDAQFPVDDDLCRNLENQARDRLLDNAVEVPKAQLAPLLPMFKSLRGGALRIAPEWNYSILTSSDDDDAIFCHVYVNCGGNAGYAKMMDIVMARRQLVLARGTTISCLRLTARMAGVNDRILKIPIEGADGG